VPVRFTATKILVFEFIPSDIREHRVVFSCMPVHINRGGHVGRPLTNANQTKTPEAASEDIDFLLRFFDLEQHYLAMSGDVRKRFKLPAGPDAYPVTIGPVTIQTNAPTPWVRLTKKQRQ
jgi:hypothetical protein